MPTYLPPLHGVSMSQAFAEAAAHANVDLVLLDTFEINHPLLASPVRLVANYVPLIAGTEAGSFEFAPCAFDIQMPEQSTATPGKMTITIPGMSSVAAMLLDQASQSDQPPTLTHRVYDAADPTAPATTTPIALDITAAKVTETQVELTCGVPSSPNRPFPRLTYKRAEYRGLSA